MALAVEPCRVDHVVERAHEGQRLRIERVRDRTLAQPVPEFVAVAPQRRKHDGAVERAREREPVCEPLAQPIEVIYVLPAAYLMRRALGVIGDHLWFERRLERVSLVSEALSGTPRHSETLSCTPRQALKMPPRAARTW